MAALSRSVSISGFSDWQEIIPNKHYDWIEQRSQRFGKLYPMGSKDAKAGLADDSIFRLYSKGISTARDAYIYNFSRDTCAKNAQHMTEEYLAAISDIEENPELATEESMRHHTSGIKWDVDLKNKLERKKKTEFKGSYIRKVGYRPFVVTNCYADYSFITRKYQMDRIFPDSSSHNRVICVSGVGSKKPFSLLMTEMMPDVQLIFNDQCFPRYSYQTPTNVQDRTDTLQGIGHVPDRIDNISDTALNAFCEHYSDDTISNDVIFDYVYGVLHAPSYREEFANDLSKMIPRIPFAPDFHAFAEAGSALAALHLGYETCEQYPLQVVFAHNGVPQPHHFRLTEKAMRFADDEKSILAINEHVSLTGIPEEAHRYVVNGRTPLEWYIDRYRIKTDKESGIVNDPNGWFADPRDLVAAMKRIVHVSVESTKIIERLPGEIMDGSEG